MLNALDILITLIITNCQMNNDLSWDLSLKFKTKVSRDFFCIWFLIAQFGFGTIIHCCRDKFLVGVEKNIMEPYEKWENNKELWMNITDGGLVLYLKRLLGNDPKVTEDFMNGWENGTITTFKVEFRIDETFIVEIASLQIEGNNFYRERTVIEEAIVAFFDKESERKRVQKMKDYGYNRKDLQSFRPEMIKVIMRYITLDDQYASILSYHFMILNHFSHNKRISLPFYLLSSLENNMVNQTKNSDNRILHQGLIMIIMEYAKDHGIKPSRVVKSPNSLTNTNVHYVSDIEMNDKELCRAMDWQDLNILNDSEYHLSQEEGPQQNITHDIGSSKRNKHPRWVGSKYKTPNSNLKHFGPSNTKKSEIGKNGKAKGKEKEIKLDIPIKI